MDLSRPLAVVTPTLDGDVLTALARADAWFTTGRLHGVLGRHSEDGIRRVLRRLVHQGIVEEQPGGNAVLYRFNRAHLAAPAVIQLADPWSALLERLRETLAGWPVQPRFAAVFGSAARGATGPDSDIDILLVRPPQERPEADWAIDVRLLEDAASRWTGNDVRVLQMTEEHVREHGRDEPVLADVASEGVPLLGDADWLRRLTDPRPLVAHD